MEKLAYLVIGASLAVVAMTFMPKKPVGIGLSVKSNIRAMHQHPPREVPPDKPVPSVNHLTFPDVMDGYNIQIITRNFKFTPAAINLESQDNEGHAHIYVNGEKIARVYSHWYHLPGTLLQPGENEVKVTLNANDHSEWSVDGDSIASFVSVRKRVANN